MLTTLAIITRILSNSTANLFQKKASEKSSPIAVNLISYFIMSLLCIIPSLFVDWGQFDIYFWGNVILAGILCTIGTIALIEALRIGDLSVLAPINSYKSVIGLIGAFFILGELPSVKELICVIFIVIGSYFVLDNKTKRFSVKTFFRRDIRLRIFALVCSGVEASVLKKIILLSSYKISLILWCFSGFLCSLIIFCFYKQEHYTNKESKFAKLRDCSIIALMLITMQLTTNYVFTQMAVAPALALFQLSSLVSVYFGYKIYHEDNILKKILGTVIMIFAGMVLILK